MLISGTMHEHPRLDELLDGPMRPGTVVWIGLRPARGEPVVPVPSAHAEAGQGLVGDRYRTSRDGPRQVTLIQAEHLGVIAGFLGRDEIEPGQLRRNLVVRGINLLALKGRRFRVGGALFEPTGACHPCSRMEEALGPGGFNAMRGHGGITARILASGEISVGNAVLRAD